MLPPGKRLYSGCSLHIGLNRVDPEAYGGWPGHLSGCVNDAKAMSEIARSLGYEPVLLLNEEATRARAVSEIERVREQIFPSDVFLLTYSGHGGQIPDPDGEEEDHLDETWCLYDGELLDDSLYEALRKFPARARITVVSDSCHSGTVVRGPELRRQRGMPPAVVQPAYEAQKERYDAVPRLGREKYDLAASVCLLSGCQDNQTALDAGDHGLFTGSLLDVWNGGAFRGDYWQFHQEILKRMPPDQSPGLLFLGCKNLGFEWSRPFVIR